MPLHAHDVFMGSGAAGPFSLSWKRIAPGTEKVIVNSLSQTRGLDYMLDADAGTLTFTRPLPPQAAAEITYLYDTGHAVRAVTALSIPASFDLARTDSALLSLDALYQRAGDSTPLRAEDHTLKLALEGGWHGANGMQVTAKALFQPTLTPLPAEQSAIGMNQLGLALGGSTDAGRLAQFSFGFSRMGTGMAGSGLNGMGQTGTQQWTLGGRFTPSRQLLAVVNYTHDDPLRGMGATGKTSVALMLTPDDRYHIQTNLIQNTGGSNNRTETASLALDARPTGNTRLTASYADTSASLKRNNDRSLQVDAAVTSGQAFQLHTGLARSSAGNGETMQSAHVAVTAHPSAYTQINAEWQRQDASGGSQDRQALNLAATLKGGKGVALTARTDQSSRAGTTDSRQELGLSLAPIPQFQLNTDLALHQTERGSTRVAAVSGMLRPAAFVEFSGTYRDRTASAADTNSADTRDTSLATVSLLPLKAVHLFGTYAQNPDSNGNTPQRLAQRDLGLETTFGALTLSGGYDWSRRDDTLDVGAAIHADIGLRFSAATKLTGGYKQIRTGVGLSPQEFSVYSVGFTHTMGEVFNMSLNGTMQQKTSVAGAASPDYTASANLGLKF